MIRIAALAAVVAVVIGQVHGRLPSPSMIVSALAGVQLRWIFVAAGAEIVSIVAFALGHRVLFTGLGVRISAWRMVAITMARSAVGSSMPAGAAVSTAYALRQFRRAGATLEAAAAVTVVSGLISGLGLGLLYAGSVGADHPRAVVVSAVAAAIAVPVAGHLRGRASRPGAATVPVRPDTPAVGVVSRLRRAAREAWNAGRELRLRHWAAATGYAVANWGTDLLCLLALLRAVGVSTGFATLAGIYLGVQIVRQLPLTPGGVGVIETAFIAALTATGAPLAAATAGILLYRLLTGWLLIPIGGAAALLLHGGGAAPRRDPPAQSEFLGPSSAITVPRPTTTTD